MRAVVYRCWADRETEVGAAQGFRRGRRARNNNGWQAIVFLSISNREIARDAPLRLLERNSAAGTKWAAFKCGRLCPIDEPLNPD